MFSYFKVIYFSLKREFLIGFVFSLLDSVLAFFIRTLVSRQLQLQKDVFFTLTFFSSGSYLEPVRPKTDLAAQVTLIKCSTCTKLKLMQDAYVFSLLARKDKLDFTRNKNLIWATSTTSDLVTSS